MATEIERELQNLIEIENDAHNIDVFRKLYIQFRSEPSKINWNEMKPLAEKQYGDYTDLEKQFREYLSKIDGQCKNIEVVEHKLTSKQRAKIATDILSRLVVLKLNGGLGTTMHCTGPKSLIELREGLNFLDLALLQNQKLNEKFESEVPLLLMNSFNTDTQTNEVLSSKPNILQKNIKTFVQSRCPRIYADTLSIVPQSFDDNIDEGWYPPGHGNVFDALARSNHLDALLDAGRDIVFISNIDNTGAAVDLPIAAAMVNGIADYLMEVTPRTATDIKGGAVINYKGALMHLEIPQVPDDHIEEFCSLRTFKIFNTNNIWVNLRAVKAKLPEMKMEILANHKKLSQKYACRPVIQLETSVGGAIRNFERALCLRVSRRRFLPVKSTQEMLALMSNAYHIDEYDSVLKITSDNETNRPLIKLSSEFAPIHEFHARIPILPDLSEAKSLEIEGDVRFGKNVKIVGNVTIRAKKGESLFIEEIILRGT